jgi:broad specificity phosphatase PhoE
MEHMEIYPVRHGIVHSSACRMTSLILKDLLPLPDLGLQLARGLSELIGATNTEYCRKNHMFSFFFPSL